MCSEITEAFVFPSQVSAESLVQHVIDPSVQDLSNAEKGEVFFLSSVCFIQ